MFLQICVFLLWGVLAEKRFFKSSWAAWSRTLKLVCLSMSRSRWSRVTPLLKSSTALTRERKEALDANLVAVRVRKRAWAFRAYSKLYLGKPHRSRISRPCFLRKNARSHDSRAIETNMRAASTGKLTYWSWITRYMSARWFWPLVGCTAVCSCCRDINEVLRPLLTSRGAPSCRGEWLGMVLRYQKNIWSVSWNQYDSWRGIA